MSSNPSVKKNLVLSIAYQILTLLTPFITAPYVSRVLEPSGIGVFSFTNSIFAYFTMFASLGTQTYGSREIARVRDNKAELSKTFWNIELLTCFTSGIVIIIWLSFTAMAVKYQVIYLILTMSLLGTMFDISWFFSGLEQFSYIVLRNTIVKAICIVCIFIFIRTKDDLNLYIFLMTLATFLGSISMWMYIPKSVNFIKKKNINIWPHLKQTSIFFLPSMAASIYTILDKTLIGVITQSENQNGYYEQATKIVNMAKAITFSALNAVLAARTSYLYAEGKFKEIKNRINRSLNFALFMGFGLTFGIIGVSNRFVPWFFGELYHPVIPLLQVLSPIIIIISISNIIGSHYYVAAGAKYLKRGSLFMAIGAIINLVLNLILIPMLQSMGAIIGSLAAETVITVLFLYYCDGYMTFLQILHEGWRKFAAGLVMVVCMFIMGRHISNNTIAVFTEVFVGAVIYCFILCILKDKFLKYLYFNILKPKFIDRMKK